MSSGFRDWIPDTPEVIARVKSENAGTKAEKKAITRKLKKPSPVQVAQTPSEPSVPVKDLSRNALLEIAKKQGMEVKGNVAKETLSSKLKASVR